MGAPYTVTVTLVTRTKGTPDAFGNDTWTESTSDVQGVRAPGGSVEQIQGMDTLTAQPTVYLPPGTDVGYLDAVVIAGHRYEVDGEPVHWRHPLTGWYPGVEVKLRRSA